MESKTTPGHLYNITIEEGKNQSFSDWFDHITADRRKDGSTVLSGRFVDQPALRGFLDQLWNLNFTILSVEMIEEDRPEDNRDMLKRKEE